MKRLLIIVCFIFLCSCSAIDEEPPFLLSESGSFINEATEAINKKITSEEAQRIMSLTDGFILLDVRTEEEYSEQRINRAILIPDYEIADRAETELPDKSAMILIYCRSGRRSANTAALLADMGYENIYDFGGILDWTYKTIID